MKIRQYIIILLLLFCASNGYAQETNGTITGVVVDVSGEPLPGVVVLNKETNVGVTSKADGTFSIKAKIGEKLQFRFVCMTTLTLSAKEHMRITMTEDVNMLEAVVVTGYQKIDRRLFTGATMSVKMDEVKLDGLTDVSRMLEARVPGLSIQNVSGNFGAAPRINIRGGASILGNVQPLWVIDGNVYEDLVPLTIEQLTSGDAVTLVGSAVAGLNPADISDIQVLKDASATSIYGARALNGVIVITTKGGVRNSPIRVSYTMELSMRQKPSYISYDLLNSQESMGLYQEMSNKGYFGIGKSLFGRRGGIYHQIYDRINSIDPNTGEPLMPNTEEAKVAFLKNAERVNTDWFDQLFTLRPTQSHSVNLSGGGEHIALFGSVSVYDDAGWTIADRARRLTGNLKGNFYIGNKIKATLALQGNIRNQKAPGTTNQKKNVVLGAFERDFDINPFAYALSTSRTLSPLNDDGTYRYYRNNWAPFNIHDEYSNNFMDIKVVDFKTLADVSWKVNRELELKGLFAFRRAMTANNHYIKEGSNVVKAFRANEPYEVAKENIYLYHPSNDLGSYPLVPLSQGGLLKTSTTEMESYTGRLSAEYHKNNAHHTLHAFAHVEIRSVSRTMNENYGFGIAYDKGGQVLPNPIMFHKLAADDETYFSILNQHERGVSFSTSLMYGYEGRYIFNAVANIEGSNSGGAGTRGRWLPTWNIGAKWNITEEEYMKKYPIISQLALRSSFGLTAKLNELAANSTATFLNELIYRPNTGLRDNVLRIRNLENRDLTWEKMYELNLGVDVGLLQNRVTATLDLYRRSSFDLIDLVRTSGVGGQFYKWANFGDMVTHGIELSLSGRPIETSVFKWDATLTFSAMKQKITRLLNKPNTFDMVSGTGRGNIEGFPRGSLFSFAFQGLNRDGLPTFDFGLYPSADTELKRIAGADFVDTQYNNSYLIYHGPVEPTMMSGLSNTLTFKEWTLSFLISGQFGNKIRLNPTFDPEWGDLNVFGTEYKQRWLNPGDEYKTNVPTLPGRDLYNAYGKENIEKAYNTYNYSQVRVADGSFVRMKNISLGYTLSKNALGNAPISMVNIKLNVTNPFLIYSDSRLKGQDPEYYRSGGVSLPTPRQYTLTLNASF